MGQRAGGYSLGGCSCRPREPPPIFSGPFRGAMAGICGAAGVAATMVAVAGLLVVGHRRQRQFHHEARALAGLAVEADLAAAGEHDALRAAQSQAGAGGFGGEIWAEDLFLQVRWDAGAGIADEHAGDAASI